MTAISARLKEKLDRIPNSPGIYKMLDSGGNIIYIGKSKCLRKRVRSYFTGKPKWEKVDKMVFFIDDIDYTATDTHLEARLLECELIKKIKPEFNSQMKNDRKYVYLKIEDYNKYNALSVVHEREKYTFGPFRKRYLLSDTVDLLKRIFPIVYKNGSYEFEYSILPVSMDKDTFNENRKNLIEIFSNKKNMKMFINVLNNKMAEASALYKYETASKYRDIVQVLNYIKRGIWHYQKLMSRDILLKIPVEQGYKLFFISKGSILLKERFEDPTDKDIALFIEKACSFKAPATIEPATIEVDEKAALDFQDIIYSEILSLPKDMVIYL